MILLLLKAAVITVMKVMNLILMGLQQQMTATHLMRVVVLPAAAAAPAVAVAQRNQIVMTSTSQRNADK